MTQQTLTKHIIFLCFSLKVEIMLRLNVKGILANFVGQELFWFKLMVWSQIKVTKLTSYDFSDLHITHCCAFVGISSFDRYTYFWAFCITIISDRNVFILFKENPLIWWHLINIWIGFCRVSQYLNGDLQTSCICDKYLIFTIQWSIVLLHWRYLEFQEGRKKRSSQQTD